MGYAGDVHIAGELDSRSVPLLQGNAFNPA